MKYYRPFTALAAVSMLGLAGCTVFNSQMERELTRKGFGIMEPDNQRLSYRWFGEGWSFRQQFSPFFLFGPTRCSSDGRFIVAYYQGEWPRETTPGLPPSGARKPISPYRSAGPPGWGGLPGLVVLDLSGREIWRIESFRGEHLWLGSPAPALSPDHEKIAQEGRDYAYYVLMRSYEVIRIPGSQNEEDTEEGKTRQFRSIDWAPDIRRIVFSRKSKLLVYDIENQKMGVVTDGNSPAWSPNGVWIAYRTVDNIGMMVSPETGERRTLFNGRKIVGPIRWSPDSEYLLYNIRHEGFANKIESLWNLGDTNYRVIVHRLRDGAEIDARSAAPIGILDHHNWAKR